MINHSGHGSPRRSAPRSAARMVASLRRSGCARCDSLRRHRGDRSAGLKTHWACFCADCVQERWCEEAPGRTPNRWCRCSRCETGRGLELEHWREVCDLLVLASKGNPRCAAWWSRLATSDASDVGTRALCSCIKSDRLQHYGRTDSFRGSDAHARF